MPEPSKKPPEKRLLDQVRDAIRTKHYSIRTEEAYVNWVRRFILFHGKRHPKDMGGPEIEAFLTHLAVEGHVSASTQNQALSALLFLYRTVLHQELDYPIDSVRAKPSQHLPAVLTKDEARQVIAQLSGIYQLQAKLLYGSGLRLLECLRLRVKDLDFERRAIIVRDTKGNEDRVTMLPDSVIEPLKEHLLRVKRLHQEDLAKGYGAVYLPDALGSEVPQCQPRMDLAVRLPVRAALRRPTLRRDAAPSPGRKRPATRRPPGGPRRRTRKARHLPHLSP